MNIRIRLTAIYEFSNKYEHKDGPQCMLNSIFSILCQQHMYYIYFQDFIFEMRCSILAFKHDDMMEKRGWKRKPEQSSSRIYDLTFHMTL